MEKFINDHSQINMKDKKKLTITFVIPSFNLTGGIRVISIYASYLANKGHNVYVISPQKKSPSLIHKLKTFLKGNGWPKAVSSSTAYFTNPKVNLMILDSDEKVTEDDVPEADVIIATFWSTAEWIASFSNSKGKKVYFLQHYELHPWLPIDRVKATFRNNFKKIVVSDWIKESLEKSEQCKVDHLILNGVDSVQFNAESRNKNHQLTVGFMYSPRSYKGSDIAINAISKVKSDIPDLKLIIFASEYPDDDFFKQSYIRVYVRPEQNKLKDIYAQCDAWIFSSLKEGFGLPILEAMACRTPVIATPAGAAPSLIRPENGVLLNSFSVDDLVTAIKCFNELNNVEWRELSENAYHVALRNSWQNSSQNFESALKEFAEE